MCICVFLSKMLIQISVLMESSLEGESGIVGLSLFSYTAQ